MIVKGSRVGEWTAKRLFTLYHAEGSEAIGLERNGELVAGVIYENWNHKSITAHIVIEGRITPSYLAAIFDYPFNVACVDKIIAPCAESNLESQKLLQNFGFTEEARIADAHPSGCLLIYTMARDACRFLGKRYGKRLSKPAACA